MDEAKKPAREVGFVTANIVVLGLGSSASANHEGASHGA